MSVSEWCERNLVLSGRETNSPGPLRFDRSPYLREPLDSFGRDDIEAITLCFAAQSGKTLALFSMLAYAIDQDPGQMLAVYPNENLAGKISRNRIDPLVEDNPVVQQHKPANKDLYQKLEKYFDTCTLHLVGSNSPTNVASHPVRYLWADEIDKFAGATQTEGRALDLAIERTESFWNRKILCTSTPTVEHGSIWRRYHEGDQRRYYVPCPHCSRWQTLRFEQLRWQEYEDQDGELLFSEIEPTVYYECESCQGKILDKHKPKMLREGEWRPEKPTYAHRSYHLNKLYPIGIRFSNLVTKYLKAKNYPDSLRNFYNSSLALPYSREQEAASEDTILDHAGDYGPRDCPEDPAYIVLTVDVQERRIFYVVRAWCAYETSYLLEYGQGADLDDIPKIAESWYQTPSGEQRITHVGIDSGYKAVQVYHFCKKYGYFPIKGESGRRQKQPVKLNPLKDYGVRLLLVQTDHFKDVLQDKLVTPLNQKGSWYVHNKTCPIYTSHLTSEILEEENMKWVKVRERNDLLDCEVYQLAFADRLRARDIRPAEKSEAPKKTEKTNKGIQRPDGRPFVNTSRFNSRF